MVLNNALALRSLLRNEKETLARRPMTLGEIRRDANGDDSEKQAGNSTLVFSSIMAPSEERVDTLATGADRVELGGFRKEPMTHVTGSKGTMSTGLAAGERDINSCFWLLSTREAVTFESYGCKFVQVHDNLSPPPNTLRTLVKLM
jgi:hypothetical protein